MKKVIAILALGASLAFGQSASIKLPGYKAGQRLIDQGKLLSQADKEKIEKAVAGAPVPTVVVVMADFPSIDNDGLYPADQFAKKYHLGKFSKQNSVVLLVSPRRGDVARRW